MAATVTRKVSGRQLVSIAVLLTVGLVCLIAGYHLIEVYYVGNRAAQSKIRHIGSLTQEPASKAVPLLIGLAADADSDVSDAAFRAIAGNFRNEAMPYLERALESPDEKKIEAALMIITPETYKGASHQSIRDIAISRDNSQRLQLLAVTTLECLGDMDALREIAHGHPDKMIREAAAFKIKQKRKGMEKGHY